MEHMENFDLIKRIELPLHHFLKLSVEYTPRIILALIVLCIGWWTIAWVAKLLTATIKKREFATPEVQTFITSIVGIGLKALLILSVVNILGVETTSFVSVIAAMSFAIGLALQGNLSNFAAGIMILLLRPFKLGDEVKFEGHWFFVKEIQIFHTIFQNFDKTVTIIPNSRLTNAPIVNLSASSIRKMNISLNIPYTENWEKVKEIVHEAVISIPEIDTSFPPFVWIQGFQDHYIKVSMSYSVPLEKFWTADTKIKGAIIKTLNKHKVQIAYPTGVAFGKFGGEILN